MNRAAKGRRLEHRSRTLLERQGYRVLRSAASKGAFDLIGVGPLDIVLLQVKSNRWPSPAEMAELAAFIVPAGCRKLVHRWRDRQRQPDVREV